MMKGKQVLKQESVPPFDQFGSAPVCVVGVTQGTYTSTLYVVSNSFITLGEPTTSWSGLNANAVCMYFVAAVSTPAVLPESDDFLTPAEISDVNESWKEIDEGKAKEFASIDDLLKELKS